MGGRPDRTTTNMEKKEKATSTSYALKALIGHVLTLRDRQLISEEEYQTIAEIHKNACKAYMAADFGMEL